MAYSRSKAIFGRYPKGHAARKQRAADLRHARSRARAGWKGRYSHAKGGH